MEAPPGKGFDYAALLKGALISLVRQVLERVAQQGLPGQHHFYLTFRTQAPGVLIPLRLRQQHPEEITIILQHQFSDLVIEEAGFSVSLRFGGSLERLSVPFESLVAFVDPAANFGLRFDASEATPTEQRSAPAPSPAASPRGTSLAAGVSSGDKVVDFKAFRGERTGD